MHGETRTAHRGGTGEPAAVQVEAAGGHQGAGDVAPPLRRAGRAPQPHRLLRHDPAHWWPSGCVRAISGMGYPQNIGLSLSMDLVYP